MNWQGSKKKLPQILIAISVALALTACAASTPSIDPSAKAKIDIPPNPLGTDKRCAKPAHLPDRALTQGETEDYWSIDRGHLSDCAGKLKVLSDGYDSLYSGLSSK